MNFIIYVEKMNAQPFTKNTPQCAKEFALHLKSVIGGDKCYIAEPYTGSWAIAITETNIRIEVVWRINGGKWCGRLTTSGRNSLLGGRDSEVWRALLVNWSNNGEVIVQ
jgi:hypothetical protein